MSVLIDLVGKTFGRWTVLERADNAKGGSARWLCRCSCGTEGTIISGKLNNGHSTSCGCKRRDVSAVVHATHRKTATPVYKSWAGMRARCENPNNQDYSSYGGRGITVDPRWRDSFEVFYADMGDPPPGTSIDRVDNDLGYFPGNTRWATPIEQANNKRNNVLLSFDGRVQSLAEWARETGIWYYTLRKRLRMGWNVEKALTTPVRSKRRSVVPSLS